MSSRATLAERRLLQPDLFDHESSFAQPHNRASSVIVAGRKLRPTNVFDTYWRFAAMRQSVYESRQMGLPAPWTKDPVIRQYRFTNCYRATDRVSQFLIRNVAYEGSQEPDEIFFRIMLFKLFNRIETWELLQSSMGGVSWRTYRFDHYNNVLGRAFQSGTRLYSPAYVVPPPHLGEDRKHANHLRLLEILMRDGVAGRLSRAGSMKEAFETLIEYPAVGPFLGYQFLIDLNYSNLLRFDEMEFVVPGPGARDGIRKCFGEESAGIESQIIRYMTDTQDLHFRRLGLRFGGLRGRPLQLIDCQNLFCEVDKYARVAHPEAQGYSGRARIKQRYRIDVRPIEAWFPPKWGLN